MSHRPRLRIGRAGLGGAARRLVLASMLALALTVAGSGAFVTRAYAVVPTVLVRGTVYADDGATPVPGCRVLGTDGPGGHSYAATTGVDGKYTLSVPAAEPMGSVIKVGFDPYDTNKANGTTFVHAWYQDSLDYENATPIDVSTGDVNGADQSLLSGARVAGRVTDEASAGVSASVEFYFDWMWSDTPDWVFFTDASGNWDGYVLEEYYAVRFVPGASSDRLIPEWYQNAASRDDALSLYVPPSGRTGINAALGVGGYISGTVTDPGGAPVEGVSVRADDETAGVSVEAVTDSSGHYETPGLPTGDYTVLFQPGSASSTLAAEYYDDKALDALPDPVHVELPAETPDISAQLGSGATIEGRITDASGTPVPGVGILVVGTSYGFADSTTDADGRYSIPYLPRDTYMVWYDATHANETLDSDYIGTVEFPVVAHADTTITLDKVLATGARISGTVTGPTGATLDGIAVGLGRPGSGWDLASQLTTAGGTFVMRGIEPGEYRLYYSALDYNAKNDTDLVSEWWNDAHRGSLAAPTPIDATSGMRMTADAQLERGVQVKGKLKRADNGAGVEGLVYLRDPTGKDVAMAYTDGAGNYVFRAVYPGPYKVYGTAWNPELLGRYHPSVRTFAAGSVVSVALPGPKTGVDIAVPGGGWVTGTVRGDGGALLAGIGVTVLDAAGEWVAETVTGPSGTYQTDKVLDTGAYKVRFDPAAYDASHTKKYALEYYNEKATFGTADNVNVTVSTARISINALLTQNAATLSGVVRDSAGGFPDAMVELVARAWQYSGGRMVLVGEATVSPDDGTYRIIGLPAGSYYLAFEDYYGGLASYPRQFVGDDGSGGRVAVETTAMAHPFPLGAGTTTNVDFTAFRAGLAQISTIGEDAAPVSGVELTLYRDVPGHGWTDVTDPWSEGGVSTDQYGFLPLGVLPGDYRFEFAAPGYYHSYYASVPSSGAATTVSLPEFVELEDNSVSITQTMTVDAITPATELYVAGELRAAGSTVGWLRSSSAAVGLVPSEQADTFVRLDSGAWTKTTGFTVSKQGTTTIDYRSVDGAENSETTKTVRLLLDALPPTTTAPSTASYVGTVTVSLTAVDNASGVAWTRWSLNAGSTWTTGTSVTVAELGDYTITYGSADVAGNTEATKSVKFSIVDVLPTSITIKTTATSVRTGAIPILSGAVTPTGMVGKNIVVWVKKPGKAYFSYSSNRTVYNLGGKAAWQYKYYFKSGMVKGYYVFKASAPAYTGFLTSTSPTTVSIRLR